MNRSILPLAAAAAFLTGCASSGSRPSPPAPTTSSGGTAEDSKSLVSTDSMTSTAGDDLDMYAVVVPVPDPLQPLNRGTFWVNHQIYVYALRPVSNGYEFIVPTKGREAVHNAFENVKFPVRFVNHLLQGNLYRATQETGKFLLNISFGVGGLGRPAQHVPFLADVPPADMAQTLAKWGLGNGFYLVIPVLGPTTLRDGVGLAGDYALNPITWAGFIWGGYGWFVAIPATNTLRSMPTQLAIYDAAIEDAIDPYLAVRTAYLQYRKEINSRAFDPRGDRP